MSAPSKLLRTRKTINAWYLALNVCAVVTMYKLPDSFVCTLAESDPLVLLAFHVVHMASMLTYFIASWSDPGFVAHLSASAKPDSRSHSSDSGAFCAVCDFVRPHASKHCKVCDRCVVRFDHHCGWIANCVGHGNRRAYLLYVAAQCATASFVLYVSVDSLFVSHRADADSAAPASVFELFQFTPLYAFYFAYKSLFRALFHLLFAAADAESAYALSWLSVARCALFFGMLVAVIFSALLALWQLFLVATDQTTYSLNAQLPQHKQTARKLNKGSSLLHSVKSFCSGEIGAKFTRALPPIGQAANRR